MTTGQRLAALLAASALGSPARSADAPKGGLTAPERRALYHLPEGSEVFPVDWPRALTSARTGKPFLDGLGRFGLLDDPEGPPVAEGDPRRLPVGLTAAPARGAPLRMLGVNCAACHVAELRHRGRAVRVDGAPGLFDIAGFYEDLFGSVLATLTDGGRLTVFLTRLKDQGPRDGPTRLLVGPLPAVGRKGDGPNAGAALLRRLRTQLAGGVSGAELQAVDELLTAPDPKARDAALAALVAAKKQEA